MKGRRTYECATHNNDCPTDCPVVWEDAPVAGRGRSSDVCGRDWLLGDEPCPYPGGCNLPVRTHDHYSERPGMPFVVRFYDETPPARTPS